MSHRGHALERMTDAVVGDVPAGVGAIVVGNFSLESGQWFVPHSHPQHQLAWARRGVLGVSVGDAYWVLPRTRALWLPAGVVHRTGATRDAVLCSLYFAPHRCARNWPGPTPVGVDGLLAHLMVHLGDENLPDDAPRRSSWTCCAPCPPRPSTYRLPPTTAYAPWRTPFSPTPPTPAASSRTHAPSG